MTHPSSPDLTAFLLAEAAQKRAVLTRRRRRPRQALKSSAPDTHASPHTHARSHRQRIGDHYEARAWEFLRHSGCILLGQQLRCPLGELDLVVREGETLVFVEVRYRRNKHFGGAAVSITRSKQARLLKAIEWWLPKLVSRAFNGRTPTCRIDFATFEHDTLVWHRDALRLGQDK